MSHAEIERIIGELKTLAACVQTQGVKLDDHIKDSRAHREEMQPLLDALRFVQTFQRFLKWGGLGFFAFAGFVYWLIRRV